MKRVLIAALLLAVMLLPGAASAAKPPKVECVTIQDGTLTYSAGHYLAGEPLVLGFDAYGYNYQGHMFKGSYFNVYSGGAGYAPYEGEDANYLAANPGADRHWAWPYREVEIYMKWNDAWLSNKDCDGDGKLDRHYGFDSYIGSGAWEIYKDWGQYEDEGKPCHCNTMSKIVAVPDDATKVDGIWYGADGVEIGPDIWGQFAVIQEVYNDPCGDVHGVQYVSPCGAGIGQY